MVVGGASLLRVVMGMTIKLFLSAPGTVSDAGETAALTPSPDLPLEGPTPAEGPQSLSERSEARGIEAQEEEGNLVDKPVEKVPEDGRGLLAEEAAAEPGMITEPQTPTVEEEPLVVSPQRAAGVGEPPITGASPREEEKSLHVLPKVPPEEGDEAMVAGEVSPRPEGVVTPASEHSFSDGSSLAGEDKAPKRSHGTLSPLSAGGSPKEPARTSLLAAGYLETVPSTTFIPVTPKIGMGKPAISKRKFSPGRPRVRQVGLACGLSSQPSSASVVSAVMD